MNAEGTRHRLYLQYRPALIEYAAPIVGSREAAEDVVQDAYIRFVPAEGTWSDFSMSQGSRMGQIGPISTCSRSA